MKYFLFIRRKGRYCLLTLCLTLILSSPVIAQVTIDTPIDGASVTGTDAISGWVCEAITVQVRFDNGPPISVPYGGTRGDTFPACGDEANGFALAWNWNLLGPGDHRIEIFVDGVLSDVREVTVVGYGPEFLTGVDGEWTIQDWPFVGTDTTIAWNEGKQNVEIVDTGELFSPPPGVDFTGVWKVKDCLDFIDVCFAYYWRIVQNGNAVNATEIFSPDLGLIACQTSSFTSLSDLQLSGDTLSGVRISDTTDQVCGFYSRTTFAVMLSSDSHTFSGTGQERLTPDCSVSSLVNRVIEAERTTECP